MKEVIDNFLPNELKAAQFEQKAFLYWKKFFQSVFEIKDPAPIDLAPYHLHSLSEKLLSSYSKEIMDEFKKGFKNQNISPYALTQLIRASSGYAHLNPQEFNQLFDQIIKSRLDGKKIRLGEEDVVDECIRAWAKINAVKAFEVVESLEIKDKAKKILRGIIIYAGTAYQPEKIFEKIKSIKDEAAKTDYLNSFMLEYIKLGKISNPFIQKTLDESKLFKNRNKEELLEVCAYAYSQLGQLDKSLEIVNQIKSISSGFLYRMVDHCPKKNTKEVDAFFQEIKQLIEKRNPGIDKNLFDEEINSADVLIAIGAHYAQTEPKKAQLFLNLLNQRDFTDLNKARFAKAYLPIDSNIAIGFAQKIQNLQLRYSTLLEITDSIKTQNINEAKKIWKEIIDHIQYKFSFDRPERIEFVLEIARQNAELDPVEGKKILDRFEDRVAVDNNINVKALFRRVLRDENYFEGSVRLLSIVRAYTLIDPDELESWIKEETQNADTLKDQPHRTTKILLIMADTIRLAAKH